MGYSMQVISRRQGRRWRDPSAPELGQPLGAEMASSWALLLLCSHLALSQGRGIVVSVSKTEVDGFRESQVRRDQQKVPAGGALVGNLLKKNGPLGGLLGRGGVVGGLLGKDGAVGSLLGKDGAVGSLLGKDGVVGGLLGKDGVVGGLLGKDGAVGSLLGKDGAVGSLLGKDGAVGSLLGKDGVVGGLLGKDGVVGGLLGKDGAVGSLLGKDGAVGSLLGKDGVVGGLLGKDGAVGNLLGQDGLLGGLLGGNGAVGNLLGQDGLLGGLLGGNGAVGNLLGQDGLLGGLLGGNGAVGNLLGQDGLLGGVLDRDGVLGGVLGKDGILDGLLGKDGILDGLLGKDGLVDGLLDAVLELLIGENGILGKNGLVGSLLGGNNGDDTGLRILNNTLPKVTLRSLPGFGHEVGFKTQLLVEVTSALGRDLCVQVDADVTMQVQDNLGTRQNTQDCQTDSINIRVRPNVALLDQPLKRLLSESLREVGCNILSAGLRVLSSLLGSRASVLPLRALGDVPPFSILSQDAIQMELNLLGRDSPARGPLATARLLLATGCPARLSLPRGVLDVLLGQAASAFDVSITSTMVPRGVSLSTEAILPLVPQLARVLPASLPLELRVQVADEPVVTVRGQKATTTLKATIDVTLPTVASSQKLLFSIDTDIMLNIIPSISDGKLQLSLELDSINLTRAPRGLDPHSVSSLADWIQRVLRASYIPTVNDSLSLSVSLPNILNTNLGSIELEITEADSFPDQGSLEEYCPGGPLSQLTL
ncbi:BPI fold-containing family B member 3-like isoform X2 [Heliangelus exortis]|uniref:BPI fold-containing family B member 3-like isoform X2 n=1 Tax=Heliangelus exortis TaxID=472823 RepID=UPI003A947B3C